MLYFDVSPMVITEVETIGNLFFPKARNNLKIYIHDILMNFYNIGAYFFKNYNRWRHRQQWDQGIK